MKRQSFRSRGILFPLSILLFLMYCGTVFAQSGTSSVNGTVVDPQGNVLATATVTLTNEQKNFTRTQTTTDSGNFAFSLIPPGQYRV